MHFKQNFGFQQYFWFCGSKLGPKMDQNCKLQLNSISAKIQNFEGIFKHCVFLIGEYLWSRFQQNQTIFGGVRAQKFPERYHIMDTESIQKTWKILNFTTAYAILMKLTTDIYIYLNKVFHLVKSWGVFHRVYKDVQGRVQTLKMNLNINFWPNLDHYLILQKTVAYLMHHLACHNW